MILENGYTSGAGVRVGRRRGPAKHAKTARNQEIVKMVFEQGLSYRQVARAQKISSARVGQIIQQMGPVVAVPPVVLRPRERALLRFIATYQMDHGGVGPTLGEMAQECGLPSVSSVDGLLRRLERKGKIIRTGKTRGIELVGGQDGILDEVGQGSGVSAPQPVEPIQ